ncbi:MAG: tetratricopeptide repeat protein [Bryobacterales bacterium]|nr:tetratricopeptide repeat protein [Bryobacterales bacterium]
MGRSISLAPARETAAFYHRASNRHYRVANGVMRRHQVDAQGREVNVVDKRIDLAIGSGNHAVTYAHRSPEGRLVQLPVSQYTLAGWAMSPGYDRADHPDFRREVGEACLFCHAAGPEPAPIDCARCHGDGAAHAAKPTRANIVNPKRLAPERALDVCLQCHLETASRGFPDSLRLPGRTTFPFRPGEALSAYKAYFDRADGADRFEVNHAGYRLLQSRCFTQSPRGALTCTTCHDPHTAQVKAQACAGCHTAAHAREPSDCAGCHLPKRRTEDAIHVRMTDHRIARRPDFTEPTREEHTFAPVTLTPFFFRAPAALLDLARLRHLADLGHATVPDYRRWLAIEPQSATAMTALAVALLREGGQAKEAVDLLRRALKAEPRNLSALNALAVHHAASGRYAPALALLQRARAANPDHSLTWINLGVTFEAQGRRADAESAYREAVRHQPDSSEARRRLQALRQ